MNLIFVVISLRLRCSNRNITSNPWESKDPSPSKQKKKCCWCGKVDESHRKWLQRWCALQNSPFARQHQQQRCTIDQEQSNAGVWSNTWSKAGFPRQTHSKPKQHFGHVHETQLQNDSIPTEPCYETKKMRNSRKHGGSSVWQIYFYRLHLLSSLLILANVSLKWFHGINMHQSFTMTRSAWWVMQ